VLLLLLEPDFGASMVTVSAVLGMLFLAGTPLLQFAVLISGVLVMGSMAVIFEPYRMKRLLAFTDPWADQFNSGYQLAQSLIAFGRGEWTGVGLGKSVQKLFYLPEAHTDFVFAVYAEEFGLVGVLFVIGLFWLLVRSAVRIGQQAELRNQIYPAYLAYGIALIIAVQALVNIGVNMGLFPTKGLTLPLVSYGGTSLLIVFLMLGVLLRIDSENTSAEDNAPAPRKGVRP
jgi:cell division protein FtsW